MLEELKIIMETIGQATGAAKQFGLLWLSTEMLKVVLGYTLGGFGVFCAFKTAQGFMVAAQEDSYVKKLRGMVDPESSWGPLLTSEKREIMEAVKRGLKRTK